MACNDYNPQYLGAPEGEAIEVEHRYCSKCDRETAQEFLWGGHERDSSQDRYECLECGAVTFGIDGFTIYS